MIETNQRSSELQVSRANVIVSMINWTLILLSLLLFGIRAGELAIGIWIAIAILGGESIRIFRILRSVRVRAQNNDVVNYFRGDAARKSFSVRDATAGILSEAASDKKMDEQDAAP